MKDIPKPSFSDFIRGEDKEEVMLEVLDKVQREQLRVLLKSECEIENNFLRADIAELEAKYSG